MSHAEKLLILLSDKTRVCYVGFLLMLVTDKSNVFHSRVLLILINSLNLIFFMVDFYVFQV